MKKHLMFLAAIFFIANLSFSQKKKDEPKQSIGLIVYTPIELTGTDKFSNDDWILYSKQNRTYTKYAVGLDFKYHLSEHISLKLWGGISNRNISESAFNDAILITDTNYVPGQISENADYNQTSYNINSGINFSTKLNKFEFNTGFELSYLHTGEGEQTNKASYLFYTDPNTPYNFNFYQTLNISSGNSYGLGLFLGAGYNIFDNFSVGTEFHQILYYSVFNGNTNGNYTYTASDGFRYSDNFDEKENFKQFSFSSIVPMISIKYKY